MRYQISHTTLYTYSQPVTLTPHTVRLIPRSDRWQTLQQFSLMVDPLPVQESEFTDLDGNSLIKLWFAPDQPLEQLKVQTLLMVETHQDNPFKFLLEPWATQLPIDYPASLLAQLRPYLDSGALGYGAGGDPVAIQLAQEIWQAVDGHVVPFLSTLNQRIYESCGHVIRETGEPFPPGITWSQRLGSCRDFVVLFMAVCRAMGLAARFVSGYQEGDPDSDDRHLHAWAEVYLPGAGWRGYDPTHGLAVADQHIALVASALPGYTAPVSGSMRQAGTIKSEMTYQLQIQKL